MLWGPVWVGMDWDTAGGTPGKTLWICQSHPARLGPAAVLSSNIPFAPALPEDVGMEMGAHGMDTSPPPQPFPRIQ